MDSEVYLVQDVTKFHPWVKSLDHIYFSVPVNLVTGLLGLPKSGKSTILAILTAQLSPSAGFVYKNNDLLDASTAGKLMTDVGYCAQKSCVISSLTGAQMLTIMGRLRGKRMFIHITTMYTMYHQLVTIYRFVETRMSGTCFVVARIIWLVLHHFRQSIVITIWTI